MAHETGDQFSELLIRKGASVEVASDAVYNHFAETIPTGSTNSSSGGTPSTMGREASDSESPSIGTIGNSSIAGSAYPSSAPTPLIIEEYDAKNPHHKGAREVSYKKGWVWIRAPLANESRLQFYGLI